MLNITISKPVKYTHIMFSSYYELSRNDTIQGWEKGVWVVLLKEANKKGAS